MAPSWVCPFLPVFGLFWLMIFLAVAWDMVWKGIALWKAGRNGHLVWFICIFIIDSIGILPIIYIFLFSQKKPTASVSSIDNE